MPETPPLSDDDIHQRLTEAIVDQRLLPGTKLVEDRLGEAFGVSRTRIRQVLIRLAQEQVVTLQPNKGASIAEPGVDEAHEVFEARRVIEAVLVQHFVDRATPADLKALADCIAAEEAARKAGDTATVLRQSGRFHLLLAETAGHRTFATFLRKLVSRTSLILMRYAPRHGAAGPRGGCRCEDHRGLLTALRGARSGRLPVAVAMQRMTDHLAHLEASLCWEDNAQHASRDLATLLRPATRR
jgi:DNA-binding GntR family transcriptional regulator